MGFGRKGNLAVWDVSGMFRYVFGERANCKLEWWTLKIFRPHVDPKHMLGSRSWGQSRPIFDS